jgi:uncharacterized protein (UPF0333 family)
MLHVDRGGLVILLLAAVVGCQGSNVSRKETETANRAAAAAAESTAKARNSKTLKVTNVMIGKRISADSRITEPTFQFDAPDTVYVSVGTVGSPANASLSAKWVMPTGKVVDSSSKSFQPKGADIVALQAAPAKGWKPGTYLVKIYADGDSVDAKTFAVKK